MTADLAGMEATGAWMVHSYILGLLAQAQRRAARLEDALATVERAFEFAYLRDEHFYEPDLHRIRGELVLSLYPDRRSEAVAEIERGLAMAREQGNKGLERRIADSLGRITART